MYLLYSAQYSWINVIRYECGTVFVVFWSYTEQSFCQMLLEVWWQTVCQRKCSSHRRNKMSTDVSHWLYSSQPGDCAFSCNHSQSGVGCPKLFHLSFLSLSVGNQMRNLGFTLRPSKRHLAVLEATASWEHIITFIIWRAITDSPFPFWALFCFLLILCAELYCSHTVFTGQHIKNPTQCSLNLPGKYEQCSIIMYNRLEFKKTWAYQNKKHLDPYFVCLYTDVNVKLTGYINTVIETCYMWDNC